MTDAKPSRLEALALGPVRAAGAWRVGSAIGMQPRRSFVKGQLGSSREACLVLQG